MKARAIFWASAALIAHTHVTYPLSLAIIARLRKRGDEPPVPSAHDPVVSLIIAAHDEERVIADRVRNALASDYPRERLEIIVASDGSTDGTVAEAKDAGADVVLDLSRRGKVEAQNAAVEVARGEVLAFSDANSAWQPDALRVLTRALGDPDVGYVCGLLELVDPHGDSLEGAYWRYEMAVRALESSLAGVTAGNGAIYAVSRDSYAVLPSAFSHDLCFPFRAVKAGRRAIFEPRARATERVAPTLGSEWRRKRRMMNRAWGIVLDDDILSPRGYPLLYAYEIASHRALRYASPFLHIALLAANIPLRRRGRIYSAALYAQAALLAGAAFRDLPLPGARLAAYYVSVTASVAVGLYDRITSGPARTWEPVEGTRDGASSR